MDSKLPISIDVKVSLSKAQTAVAVDMTNQMFNTPNVDFLHGSRVQAFQTSSSFNEICEIGDSVYWAGVAFFTKTDRPEKFVVGKVFQEDQEAYLLSPSVDFGALANITDGAMKITVNGNLLEIGSKDFTGASTISQVANILNIDNPSIVASDYNGQLIIRTTTPGNQSTISTAFSPDTGTDISEILGLTADKGAQAVDGYTAGSLVEEVAKNEEAAIQLGLFIYAWTLDSSYRDTQEQKDFATWVNSKSFRSLSCLCTNNPTAYNPNDTTNIGYVAKESMMSSIATIYHDNAQVYPDVSYCALLQAVNYLNQDSTIAVKFKKADGIANAQFPSVETNWLALESRRINTLLGITGQSLSYFRNGVQSDPSWRSDGWVNICNFIADLEIEILNTFLRNKKLGYTTSAQDKLLSAAGFVGNKYKNNGSFADREVQDETKQNGISVLPAVAIDIQPLSQVSAAQRVGMIGTPLSIVLQDSGVMGEISINVEVVE